MRVATVILAMLAALVVGILIAPPIPAPVPVAETPKLVIPHVVYFWVCDEIIGALITTKPPIWSDVQDGMPSDEVYSIMIAAESVGHSIEVKHWHQGCFTPVVPDPTEQT